MREVKKNIKELKHFVKKICTIKNNFTQVYIEMHLIHTWIGFSRTLEIADEMFVSHPTGGKSNLEHDSM